MIELLQQVEEADRQYIKDKVKAFNRSMRPEAYDGDVNQIRPIDVILKDADGTIIAGALADVYWGSAYLAWLWVDDSFRGAGLGQQVMATFEAEARAMGCTFTWVRTFSWQARGFYEKLGYRVVGQLQDHPPGAAFYTLRKDF